MDKKTICLNMIVKDEIHILLATLQNILDYIPLDYWVICDTGSTDGTQDAICSFFYEKGIPGELIQDSWVDFGYNRSRALTAAFGKTDYLLIFDADDKIMGDLKLPPALTCDKYLMTFGPGFSYLRPLLISNRKRWCFKGVLHECLSDMEPMNGEEVIKGDYYIISGRSGNRSKNPNKYLDDAVILKKAFEKEMLPGGDYGMACRYAFYCAQSYKDSGHNYMDDAIEWYKKVLTLDNWVQEKYFCCLTMGELYKYKQDLTNACHYWLKTVEYDSERIEGIVSLVEHYHSTGQHLLVNIFYTKFKGYKRGLPGKLFVYEDKYNDLLEYYNSISSFYTFDKLSGYQCCKQILVNRLVSGAYLKTTLSNLLFYKDFLERDQEDTLDLFYAIDSIFASPLFLLEDINVKYFSLWETLFSKNRDLMTRKPVEKPINPNKTRFGCDKITVFLSITSCKRLDLFKQTMNSILVHWLDLDKIDYWFCVDDNSSEEDRKEMCGLYPWLDYYMKTETEKGHRTSMNLIWNKLKELNPTYWIHLEDDFLFHSKMNYVTESINILNTVKHENIRQVLFNRNYGEVISHYNSKGHLPIATLDSAVLHDYKQGHFPYTNCHYWPHYSFRPSLTLVETILSLGNYDSVNQFFELDYANKWTTAGYKSCFFNRITNRHIGRLTSERNANTVKNAYQLNNEEQFSLTLSSPGKNIKIVNLERRSDRRENIVNTMKSCGIENYEFIKAVDGKTLLPTKELKNLFQGNDFGSRRGFIGCAMSHYNLWQQLLDDPENEYYIIMEDDFTLGYQFKERLLFLQKQGEFTKKPVIFMGYHMYSTKREPVFSQYNNAGTTVEICPLNKDLFIGGTHCYSIHKTGAQILVDYIRVNGIKHGIDYLMKIVPALTLYESQPHLAFAEWYEPGKKTGTDTDIQNSFDSLDFSKEYNGKDNFVFIPFLDQYGNDLYRHPYDKKTLEDFFLIAEQDEACVGFNTLGFFKSAISTLTRSSYLHGETSGLYIKKGYYMANKELFAWMHKTMSKTYTFTNTWFLYSELKTNSVLRRCTTTSSAFISDKGNCYHALEKCEGLENGLFMIKDTEFSLDINKPISILEIGGYEGAFSTYCLDSLLLHESSILHVVDPYDINDPTSPVFNSTKSIFLKNCSLSNFPDKVIHYETYSDTFFASLKREPIYDFIYIDGLHTAEQVIKDLDNSCYYLKDSGIIWVDDYKSPELTRAIDSWVEKNKELYRVVHKGYQMGISKRRRIARIKMLCNWCSPEQLRDEWSVMYETRDRYIWNNLVELVLDGPIDFYVIINQAIDEEYYEPGKTLLFPMEPWVYDDSKPWGVKTWGKWASPSVSDFFHVHDKSRFLNAVQWQISGLDTKFFDPALKQDRMSSICSAKKCDVGHILRTNFINYMEQNGITSLDVYGKENYHGFTSYKGPLINDDKLTGFETYKYYFMAENNAEHNYATEKIWEPILCECLCFYWGCPNLEDHIDSNAFVRLDLENMEESFSIIQMAIKEDWWSQRIDCIRREKQRILTELGFFPTLYNLISNT